MSQRLKPGSPAPVELMRAKILKLDIDCNNCKHWIETINRPWCEKHDEPLQWNQDENGHFLFSCEDFTFSK